MPSSTETREARRRRRAERQRRYRQRRGDPTPPVRLRPIVLEALIARAVDGGASPAAAEAESRNRGEVARQADEILEEWARRYLAQRNRYS